MLRHSSLIPLSRQHHNALALGVLGRRWLADDGVEAVARRAVAYYDQELAAHLAIEEEVLFPLCAGMPIVEELIAEHRALARMIAELRVEPSAGVLEDFYTLLTAHVRREERELFEAIPQLLAADVLEQAGAEIARRAAQVCIRP